MTPPPRPSPRDQLGNRHDGEAHPEREQDNAKARVAVADDHDAQPHQDEADNELARRASEPMPLRLAPALGSHASSLGRFLEAQL